MVYYKGSYNTTLIFMSGGEIMGVTDAVQLVSTVGFPIFMCLIMGFYIKNLTDSHKEETKDFTEALNQNTLVLQKLCDTMGIDRN